MSLSFLNKSTWQIQWNGIFNWLWLEFFPCKLISKLNLNCILRSQFSIVQLSAWKPHLIKHIEQLKYVQRLATKCILNDYSSDYKSCVTRLHMLPLDVNDVTLFLKSVDYLHDGFDLKNFIKFSTVYVHQLSGQFTQDKGQTSKLSMEPFLYH